MSCILCERLKIIEAQKYPFLIHEFKNSYLVLGEHQYYKGYSVLITKKHFREMTDIPEPQSVEVFQEMMKSSKAIEEVVKPTKMNMCSLGNVCDHIHWHFFPRFADDPLFRNPPWLQMHLFDEAKVTPEECKDLIVRIRGKLS
jgi:diadenosine tetraphosphate (Ap4A) HIT family hydrolase